MGTTGASHRSHSAIYPVVDVPRRRPLRRVFSDRSPDAVSDVQKKLGGGVSNQKWGGSSKYVECNLDLDDDLEDITTKLKMMHWRYRNEAVTNKNRTSHQSKWGCSRSQKGMRTQQWAGRTGTASGTSKETKEIGKPSWRDLNPQWDILQLLSRVQRHRHTHRATGPAALVEEVEVKSVWLVEYGRHCQGFLRGPCL